jgi:hypothetical protein
LAFSAKENALFYPSASFCCKWVKVHNNNGWGTFLKHVSGDQTGYQISGMPPTSALLRIASLP